LPLGFIYFIGVCEVLGALGLVLPGALNIRRGLTPVAAVGLTIIMLGAVVVSVGMDPAMAIMPFVVGLLTAFIAYRRWPWLAG
jgi:DoxX-like family